VIGRVLGADVEHDESWGDVDADLLPEERPAVARAVESRQREHAAVRACARRCLVRLGVGAVAIPTGPGRAPVWPAGVVGSLTHADGYRAAAVARADRVVGLGIDAEVHAPLPDGVLDVVAAADERTRLGVAAPGVHGDRVLFSAKESVFKAWWPLVGEWLDFLEADVTLGAGVPDGDGVVVGGFDARLLRPGLVVGGRPVDRLRGRWAVGDGLVVTAVVLPRP